MGIHDAAFALRRFKSRYAADPSCILMPYKSLVASKLEDAERKLLRVQCLYETQAQLAGIPREKFAQLGSHTLRDACHLGRLPPGIKDTLQELKMPPQTPRLPDMFCRHCKIT